MPGIRKSPTGPKNDCPSIMPIIPKAIKNAEKSANITTLNFISTNQT